MGCHTARILLVDDHEGTRSLLVSILLQENFEVCGEATSGEQAIGRVLELQPDLVLLDILMPEMNGVEAASRIRRIAPQIKIILISGYLPINVGSEAARVAGAQAYVEKSSAARDLIPTIRNVLAGEAQHPHVN
jgi:NarL family two-component system response regulator LiaR